MPRQTARKAQNTVAETPAAVQVATQVATQSLREKKTRGRKPAQPSVQQPPVVPAPVPIESLPEKKPRGRKPAQPAQPVQESTQETVQETTQESSETKKRVVPTADTLKQEFDELSALIESEISSIKESSSAASKSSAAVSSATTKVKTPSTKTLGVKFLRTVNKRLKILAAHTARVTKQRKNTTRRNNANSGFRKPVQISDELARFTGWDPSQHYSRVDVTKYMCNYIREKGLQRPEDKREIQVQNDPALQQLLKYYNTEEPLRYYSLQTYLAPHFQTAASTASATA